MSTSLRPCLGVFLVLTLVTGVGYPLLITGIAKLAFPARADGSVIEQRGHLVGSSLLGQQFTRPEYFWGRPSATTPQAYNGGSSNGSNLAPTNPALTDGIAARVKALRAADPSDTAPVPVDLVTASASGLDPHISPAAAEYQVARVARARGWTIARVRAVVVAHTESRTLGILGEPRVNVLELNLALDAVK